jgi:hypothetical protein
MLPIIHEEDQAEANAFAQPLPLLADSVEEVRLADWRASSLQADGVLDDLSG